MTEALKREPDLVARPRRTMSEETKRKMSLAKSGGNHPLSKPVREKNSGLIFGSKSEAAKHFDVNPNDVGWSCQHSAGFYANSKSLKRLKEKGLEFEYVKEKDRQVGLIVINKGE